MKTTRVIVILLTLNSLCFGTVNTALGATIFQGNNSYKRNCINTKNTFFLAKTKKIEICCNNSVCRECGRRGNSNTSIINPPRGSLLNQKPEFSWSSVANVRSYIVRLEDGRGILWEREVSDTKLAYPENETPLKLGKYYVLKIKANNSEGKTISSGKTSFRVVSQAEAEEVTSKVQTIYDKKQNSDKTALEIAAFYQQQDLITAAINILDKEVNNNSQNPQIYLMLGELYRIQVRNYQQAEEKYQQALTLAKNTKNQNAQVEAEIGIAKVYLAQGKDIDAARSLLQKAYDYYKVSNNQEKSSSIAKLLEQIEKILEKIE